MLEVFDKSRLKLAILQNATGMIERVRINAISNFEFSLPETDAKNEYCQQFNLIRYKKGEFYRITGEKETEGETGLITYTCEHVIALLMDTCIPEFVHIGGLGYFTTQAIQYILSKQNIKHWVLKECDFARQFEYGLEKENLLSALFSISNRFVDKFQWVTNTKVYPYEISLKRFNENRTPDHKIRRGHNRLKLERKADSTYLCTRLYAYGAGEGVNQLDIADLNGGKKYLQSPQEFIDKYGLIEKVWTDRRYTVQQSLLEATQVMLDELQNPYVEYETQLRDKAEIGDVVEIVGFMKTYVVETETYHQEIPIRYVKIANKPQDIAGSVADLADRQRIEMTYSQGATQVYAAQGSENADNTTPFTISLYIPTEMIHINSVFAKIRIGQFRAYNTNLISGGETRSSSAGGSTVSTTSDGGATTSSSGGATTTASGGGQTTSAGGSVNTSSGSGGASNLTSASGGQQTSGASSVSTTEGGGSSFQTTGSGVNVVWVAASTDTVANHTHGGGGNTGSTTVSTFGGHTHTVPWTAAGGTHNHSFQQVTSHGHNITLPTHQHGMNHTHSVAAHTHTVATQNHTHTITVSAHSHTVDSHTHSISSHTHTIGNHTHSLTIGNHTHTVDTSHTHNITPKISFFGNPSSFALLVNNTVRANFNGRDAEIDLTQYLVTSDGKIPRGQWLTIGIRPNDIAYVDFAYNIMGFCQSRGDTNV